MKMQIKTETKTIFTAMVEKDGIGKFELNKENKKHLLDEINLYLKRGYKLLTVESADVEQITEIF